MGIMSMEEAAVVLLVGALCAAVALMLAPEDDQ